MANPTTWHHVFLSKSFQLANSNGACSQVRVSLSVYWRVTNLPVCLWCLERESQPIQTGSTTARDGKPGFMNGLHTLHIPSHTHHHYHPHTQHQIHTVALKIQMTICLLWWQLERCCQQSPALRSPSLYTRPETVPQYRKHLCLQFRELSVGKCTKVIICTCKCFYKPLKMG